MFPALDLLLLKDKGGTLTDDAVWVIHRIPKSVWAVTANPAFHTGYRVTHVPSTTKVGSWSRRHFAKRLAEALSAWAPKYRSNGKHPAAKRATPLDWAILHFARWLADGSVGGW